MSEWVKSSGCASTVDCVEVTFRKSSMSATNGQCVEVGFHATASCASSVDCVEVGECGCDGGTVHVRDSKDPGGPVLTFNHGEWNAFLAGVKNGEFNPGV